MTLRELSRVTIGLLFLVTPGVAVAQATTSQSTMASNVPVLASGVLQQTIPGDEETPPNAIEGSINVSGYYNDNVFPNVSPRQWDMSYVVDPTIAFEEVRPRIEWKLAYTPGVEVSQRGFHRDLFAQKFQGNLTWLVSPHGSLSMEQYYSVTTSPFAGTGIAPGPTIAPNDTIFLANVRQRWLMSHLLYSYQASARTTMGVGGDFQLQSFDNIPASGPTTSLIHSQVASGEAYISHRFSERNQLGFQYGGQVLKFPETDARTTTHSFLVFDQMNFSDRSILTVYGGPEYSLTAGQIVLNLGFVILTLPVRSNQWSGSGGVLYSWTGDRFAASIDVSRRVSDGGAVFGAVELTSGKADLAWRLTKNWSLTFNLLGADDQLLSVSAANNEIRSYSGHIGLQRQLWKGLTVESYYERLNQTGSINGLTLGNRDVAGASLQYSFLKPVGR